jgi:pyruvate carboxylase subunit B
MGCDTIAIKDMAGLLTPYVTFELVKSIRETTGLPVHTHSHATAGLAAMVHLKAVEAGAAIVDTCIGAFAEGASHTTTQSFVAALQGTEFDTGLSLPVLEEISAYFKDVRKKYWQFESAFTEVDTRVLINQVPGGMISNLANQLKEQGALEKMDGVLEEIPLVRRDLGYPPLVTPTSQIVGTQAVLNVLTGSRYKSITNEVKLYLQGRYGAPPGPVNDEVRQLAIGNLEIITARPADLISDELEKMRGESDGLTKSDEDVLTYAMFPELARIFLQERAAGALKPEQLLPHESKDQGSTAVFAPDEFRMTLHGETYHIKLTGSGKASDRPRPFFVTVDGVSEEVLLEALNEVEVTPGSATAPPKSDSGRRATSAGQKPKATHKGHVTAAMPGTIVNVQVTPGQRVQAGDPVLVVEAMKMENEVQASITGTVINIFATKGEAVTPDMALVEIQPE